METGTITRSLPPTQERILFDLQGAPQTYDGRQGKAIEGLLEVQFVEVIERDDKNPRKVKVAITSNGKYALERVKRGVGPYLRMTD